MDNLDYQAITPPAKMTAKMYLIRCGKILFALSLIMTIISILPSFSLLLIAGYILFWFIVVICSLGTIFVTNPEFAGSITSVTDNLANITTALLDASYYLLPLAIVAGVCSIIFLVTDKTDKHIPRIVFSSIFIAIAVILLIIRIANMV